MRWPITIILLTGACTGQANHLGNPLLLPLSGLGTSFDNAAYSARRAKVDVFVKSNYPTILAEINAGGGPTLNGAMDIAGIPAGDRPARNIQLRADIAIYQSAPSALVTALMVYGS